MIPASPLPSPRDARPRTLIGAAALLLLLPSCMPKDIVDETTTNLTDPDASTSTTNDGPTTLGTTTSTVTTEPTSSSGSTVDPTTGTSTSDSDTTTTTSTTSGDPPCNLDGVCDPDEDVGGCLADCAGCEPDETCDLGSETPFACPSDCAPTECDHDGGVDPLTEQCDDGNQENGDACTNACKLNVCGDGYLFPTAKGGAEECDDGNLNADDGCSPQCIRERRIVFATSETYKGNLTPAIDQLVGLELGDAHCQVLANDADLPGVFRAWLSTQSKSPANRFEVPKEFTGIYELPTGVVVAEGWSDLTDGSLDHAIDVDEKGVALEPSAVWTNTSISGSSMVGGLDCQGWTSNNFNDKAPVGSTQAINGAWTEADPIYCSVDARLYCVQVE